MKKLTRFVSVLLSALMVASMFTALNSTAFAADSKLTIRANSNIFPTQTQEFDADTNQITVTWWMQVSDANMVNTQCVITYDSSKLAVDMTDGVNSTIQDGKRVDRILRVTDGVGTVTNYAPQHTYTDLHENNPSGKFLDGESDNDASIKVNSVNLEGRELTESNGKVPFVSVTFNPKDGAQGVTNVNLYVEIMQIRGESEEEEHYFIARSEIADNKVSYMPETSSAVYAGTFDDYSVQAGDVFTVAGTANFLGTEWEAKPTVNVMTKGSDGIYKITVKNVKAVSGAVYEVKVVEFKNGDQSSAIWHGVPGTGNNVDFGLKSDCDVTVTYNPSTGEIKVTGTGVTDPSYKIDYVAVVGNGKDVPSFVNGKNWDPTAAANKMTASSNVYEITYKNVAANKDLEFKFAANGAWALNWGNGSAVTPGTAMDAYDGGENIKFNYKSSKSTFDLTLKLDLTNWDADKKTGAKFTVTAKDSEEPTEAPTTAAPTTAAPTTAAPTTAAPTTAAPTTKPVTTTKPTGDVFTLAGSSNFLGTAWAPTPDEYVMTKGSDGNYTITVPSVAAEAGAVYQVKVVEFRDGDTENPIWHGKDGGDANVDFGLKSDCDVTVTYNPTTKEIKVTGAGVTEPTYNVNYVTAVGNGYGNFLNGVNWGVNDESNRMEMVSADVYEITYEEVDSNTDLKFKFAANGTWVLNWGYTGEVIPDTPTDAHFDGADILFNYESENDYFDLTLRLDLTNWDADKRTGAKFTVTAKDCEQPTTEKPEPTTVAPTTAAPTTVAPTTVAPTTVAPTTVAPTTVAPTTEAPTTEPVHVHTIVVDKGYPATCTSTGLTDGSHCETCGEVIKAQEVIPMHHDTMVVKGYPATYEKDGLTDGVRCKRCGTWVVERQVIPKLIRYGDVNQDGEITIEDATLLQKFIAELVTFNEDQKRAADTNGDGQIRIDDVTEIQKYVAELIHELGPKQTSS
ncbi:dockerin type I domain-containing protein [Ruminococcus sp.]|uniref:dockerin type I domain-containing protein n=1 Tax=Ruminococcus sp. TaxID=41978 RepID=UPI003862E56A